LRDRRVWLVGKIDWLKNVTTAGRSESRIWSATAGPHNCYEFMKDVAARLATRVQLTTDGLTWYIDAVTMRSVSIWTSG